MRRFTDDNLVIATHNPGKLVEIADLMTPLGIAVQSAGALGVPEPDETEQTFEGNAVLKATLHEIHRFAGSGGRFRAVRGRIIRRSRHLLRPLGRAWKDFRIAMQR